MSGIIPITKAKAPAWLQPPRARLNLYRRSSVKESSTRRNTALAFPRIQDESYEQRFLTTVDTSGDCWIWTGCINAKTGYGLTTWQGKTRGAHRVAYALFVDTIPAGKLVLHHCDNRPCVRPAHLYVGTYADNGADMLRRGRSLAGDKHPARRHPERLRRGERHPSAKLNEQAVRQIRKRYAAGEMGTRRLAREYGITRQTLSALIKRETWRRVD